MIYHNDPLIAAIVAERKAMQQSLQQAKAEFDAEVAKLRAELRAAWSELHEVRTLQRFSSIARDPTQPLH